MKSKILLLALLLSLSLFSQENLTAIITGDCSNRSGTYQFNGIVNGKNHYQHSERASTSLGYNGSQWMLYQTGQMNGARAFNNLNTSSDLTPPKTGWTGASCNGTFILEYSSTLKTNNLTHDDKQIIISPNPSSENIEIKGLKKQHQRGVINNINGKKIKEIKNIYDKINISSLSKGIYFIIIDNTYSLKFLKN
ncbi:T9SS type A sorting domain-containing protein [Flavivirga eckloniae]|uniref:Secretion system C-terminal sorting domain-containing protein n=1 Tax=Flavivirga eckloniae TaxID=1803846 RepID=A0A2K9PNP5_9FLAO|nr:T9SS type A sorting domain-containing protein [Flavivirga eckloniae]AUP78691.1 hypothetical protein C1H87_08210 [Flavivirga eckloniae]